MIAIYNLGILMEPNLELNAAQLFKEFSKSTSLILLWDNKFDTPDRLEWSTQKNNFFLDFSESQLKKLEYVLTADFWIFQNMNNGFTTASCGFQNH